jgi:hypothetical protein
MRTLLLLLLLLLLLTIAEQGVPAAARHAAAAVLVGSSSSQQQLPGAADCTRRTAAAAGSRYAVFILFNKLLQLACFLQFVSYVERSRHVCSSFLNFQSGWQRQLPAAAARCC